MRMTVNTEQLLQDGAAPEYVYHHRTDRTDMAAKNIHKEMLPMYGEHCLWIKQPSKTTSFGGTLS
jgi:hypothetical protein